MDSPEVDLLAWAKNLAAVSEAALDSATPWASSSPTTCATPSIGNGWPRPA